MFDCPTGTASVPGFRLNISDDKHYLFIADTYHHIDDRVAYMLWVVANGVPEM